MGSSHTIVITAFLPTIFLQVWDQTLEMVNQPKVLYHHSVHPKLAAVEIFNEKLIT